MKRFIISTLLLLIIIIVGGYFALLAYINSASFRSTVEQAASEALNAQVKIPALGFSPPFVVTATDIRVSSQEGTSAGGLRRLELEVAPLTIFSKNVIVTHLRLTEPDILWRTDEQLPAPAFQNNTTTTSQVSPQLQPESSAPPPAEIVITEAAPLASSPPPPQDSGPTLTVERVSIINARVKILDDSDTTLVELRGANLDATLISNSFGQISGTGNLNIDLCRFPENITITQATSPISFSSEKIELPEITARFHDGSLSASFLANVLQDNFEMQIAVLDSSLRDIAESRGQRADELGNARLSLFMDSTGPFSGPESLIGKGEFHAGPLALEDIPIADRMTGLLGTIGVGDTRRMRTLTISKILSDIELRDRKLHILNLRSEPTDGPLLLAATGTVGFDSLLDIAATLKLDSSHMGLPTIAINSLGGKDDKGYVTVPFTIGGTTSDPKVDMDLSTIANALGGEILQQAAQVIDQIARPENIEKIQREGERVLRAIEGIFAPPKRDRPAPQEDGNEN